MLSDKTTYRELDQDPTPTFIRILGSLVEREVSLGILSQRQADFIQVSDPTMAVFH